jgi:hypothetical protein
MTEYKLTDDGVLKNGRLNIPNDPGNRHWLDYLSWLEDGNTPDPQDRLPAPPVRPLNAEELFDMLKGKGVIDDVDRPRLRS